MRRSFGWWLSRIGIFIFGGVFIFPFIWMLVTSLKPSLEVFSSGIRLTGSHIAWENYVVATQSVPLLRILVNSAIVALGGSALTVTVSVLSAYAFARLRFRFRDRLFLLYLGTLVLPQEVLIIPLFLMFNSAGLTNSYVALIVPFAFGAFGTFLLRQFILSLPHDYEEAARVDGAGPVRNLIYVVVPLLKAPISVVGVFSFIGYWDAFLWPLIIVNDSTMATVPLGLSMFTGERGTDWGGLMAASTLGMLPTVIVLMWLQKHLVQGIAMSGMGGR